jgi:hypothetical protein
MCCWYVCIYMVGLQTFVNVTYKTLIIVKCYGMLKRLCLCASLQDTYVCY